MHLGKSEYFPKEFVKYSLSDQWHKHVTPSNCAASYFKEVSTLKASLKDCLVLEST